MSTMSALQRRVDDVVERADALLVERLRREEDQLERQDADARRAAADQARADAFRRTEIAERYDPAFAAFGERCPQAIADEHPGRYRRRLYEHLRRKLPDSHDLVDVRADELPAGPALANFEALLFAAAKAEAQRPSQENLPPDGMISRVRVDSQTGEKTVNFYGRKSFIHDFTRPGRKVQAIVDPRSQTVIWGQPRPQAR